jgi:hypothetical protein
MKRIFFLAFLAILPAAFGQAQSEATAQPSTTVPSVITIPVGTRVLAILTSPLHTTSAQAGSGVYLETVEPVVQNNRVVIPPHTRMLGTVKSERRPGRIHGRARFQLHFDTLVLPNEHVISMQGILQSLPGSFKDQPIDAEGTIEPVDQIDRDVYTVVGGAAPGALLGAIAHGGVGPAGGAAIGAGVGLAKALFTRGDEIDLPVKTRVEVVLQHSLEIEESWIPAPDHAGVGANPEPQLRDKCPRP